MKKAIAAIMLCVALTLCMSLSAFAETGVTFDIANKVYVEKALVNVKNKPNVTAMDKWVASENISYSYNPNMQYGDNAFYMLNRFGKDIFETYPSTDYQFMGFEIIYKAYTNAISVDSGYYMIITIAGDDTTSLGSFMGGVDLYFNGVLYDMHGVEHAYRTSPVVNETNDRWQASLVFRIGDNGPCSVDRIRIKSNMPSTLYGSMYYDVNIAMVATVYPTEAQRLHDEMLGAIDGAAADIIDANNKKANDVMANDDANTGSIILNQSTNREISDANQNANRDANTNKITQNQNANTNKVIENENKNHEDLKNGWDSPDGDPGGDVDDMTGNMGDAEDAALGGKSDEEIQAELTGLISSDSFPGPTSSGMVSSLFDDMLKAFGNEYQAILMLSLVLGLAAFLVGRQYRAKGD